MASIRNARSTRPIEELLNDDALSGVSPGAQPQAQPREAASVTTDPLGGEAGARAGSLVSAGAIADAGDAGSGLTDSTWAAPAIRANPDGGAETTATDGPLTPSVPTSAVETTTFAAWSYNDVNLTAGSAVPPSGTGEGDGAPLTGVGCGCAMCGGWRGYSEAGTAAEGGSPLEAPGAPGSLQTLANYLRVGFWDDFYGGASQRYYNVDTTGTGANSGVLYYNVAGYSGDSNGISAARQVMVREAFKLYEEVLGINFIETTSTATHVDFFFGDNVADRAFASSQTYSGNSGVIDYTTINVAAGWSSGSSNIGGTNGYTFQTFIHEIGHGLGLGHQGLYNAGSGSPTYANSAIWENDSWQLTMMSYWDQAENTSASTSGVQYAQLVSPMAVDWIALNNLYSGQGFSTNNAFNGNTIWGVGTNISSTVSAAYAGLAGFADTNAFTIVDGSGIDTIDFSNYAANQRIDLNPSLTSATNASRSNVGGLTGNMTIAVGTVIENATTGSGDDTLIGNSSDNYLDGNGGNDVLDGNDGDDTLDGGTGIDALDGGLGNDLYIVDNIFDTAAEVAGGVDEVRASASHTLSANLENLTQTGTLSITGTGNARGNVILGNTGANLLSGLGGDDSIVGSDGVDTLNGGDGNDTLAGGLDIDDVNGGAGDDRILFTSGQFFDHVDGGTGHDTLDATDVAFVQSRPIYDFEAGTISGYSNGTPVTVVGIEVFLGASIDETIISDGAGHSYYGNGGDDYMVAELGSETLSGGSGTDTLDLTRYSGDYTVNMATGLAADFPSELFVGFEHLFSGAGDDSITGTTEDNLIGTGAGNDTINAGEGRDSVYGGDGNDTFIDTQSMSSAGTLDDVYSGGDGVDTLVHDLTWVSTVTFDLTLGYATYQGNRDQLVSIENLTVGGSAAVIGSADDNILIVNGTGANDIDGRAGNDTIVAGGGDDSVLGGSGDDLINGGDGNDTIVGGTGVDTVNGADGDDRIVFSAGGFYDNVAGGLGNDTLDASAVNRNGDVFDFELGTITGFPAEGVTVSGIEVFIGGLGDETIISDGGGQSYFGGAGDDYMVAELGNETMDGGVGGNDTLDTARWSGPYTLNLATGLAAEYPGEVFTNFENVITGAGNDNITGTAGANHIRSGAGADTINGGDGNDTVDGGAGIDSMVGGFGDDLYIVDNVGDVAGEVAGGIDTVESSVTHTLSVNLENLTLTGAGPIDGTGNFRDNLMLGNAADNALRGLAGNDTLDGGGGNDSLLGGAAVDSVLGGAGDDVILFSAGEEYDHVHGGLGDDTLDATAVNRNGDVFDFASGTITGLGGVLTVSGIEVFRGGLGSEVIRSDGGGHRFFGNGGDDVMTAGAGIESMDGGVGGADALDLTVNGGAQVIDLTTGLTGLVGELFTNFEHVATGGGADSITGTAGDNSVQAGAGNDTVNGGDGNDSIDGMGGDDSMLGGLGDDVYVVSSALDVVKELNNQGVDRVQSSLAAYTLTQFVENLELIGVGNVNGKGNGLANAIGGQDGDNFLEGVAGADTLHGGLGNDTLNGGTGIDSLVGGLGDDNYRVDSTADVVVEAFGEGTDTVESNVAIYELTSDVENLINRLDSGVQTGRGNALANTITGNLADDNLLGQDGNDTINGGAGNDTLTGGNDNDTLGGDGGNDSLLGGAGDDSLTGGLGNDTLSGAAGIDTLKGGQGDDDYQGVTTSDSLTELSNQGYDRVFSNGSYTLGNHFEYLELSSGASGTGNGLDNTLVGNSGNNTLFGLAGADVLYGRAGNDSLTAGVDAVADQFVFDTALNAASNVDTLLEAEFPEDQIVLDNDIFTALLSDTATSQGTLDAAYYQEGAGFTGGGAGDAIGVFYNLTSGGLYYNPTAGVGGDSILFAIVSGATNTLDRIDFTLVD